MMVRGNARLLFLAFPDRLLADYELCSIRYSFPVASVTKAKNHMYQIEMVSTP